MGLHSLRILAQAGFSGVFFAAKILRRELPRYRLPLAEFAANVIPCSAPLKERRVPGRKGYTKSFCILLFLSRLKRALDYLRSDFGLKITSANLELYRKFKLRYRHELELLSQIMAVS